MKSFIEYEFWKYMFECMKFDFLFFVPFFLFFFVVMVHLWKCMFQYIKFDFFFTTCRMHLWIHESLIEYEFPISMKMHVWVYEIWFFILFEELKHKILFFIFIFSDDNEWNSIFLNDHFDADVCTIVFLKWLYKWWFFQ